MTKFWTFLGKLKLVLSQLGIYFSVGSMVISSTLLWDITISPILESYGVTPNIWWGIAAFVVIIVALIAIEWNKSTAGFIRSWVIEFYAKDNPLRKDVERMQATIDNMAETITKLEAKLK